MTETAVRTLGSAQLTTVIRDLATRVGEYVIFTVHSGHDPAEEPWSYLAQITGGTADDPDPALRLLIDGRRERTVRPTDLDVVAITLLSPYERRIAYRMMRNCQNVDMVLITEADTPTDVEMDRDSYDRYAQVRSANPFYCVEFQAQVERVNDLVVYCMDPNQALTCLFKHRRWVPDLEPLVQDLHKGTDRVVTLALTIRNWP